MKIKPFLKIAYNKVSKDIRLSPEVLSIPIVGAYQVINNHKKAHLDEKKNTFKRDSLVLLATCIGALGGHGISSAALKNATKLNIIKKDLIKMVFIPIGGIITGFLAGEFAEKYYPAKYHNAQKALEEKVSQKITEAINKKEEKPKRVDLNSKVFKSAFILTMSTAGVLLGNEAAQKALKSNYIKNLNLREIPKAIISLSGSLLGGLGIGKITSLSINEKKKPEFNIANDNIAGILNHSVSTITGFNVGTQSGLQNKVQRGFYELISSVLLPASIVIPSSHFLTTKINNNKIKPNIYKALNPLTKDLQIQKKLFQKSITLSLLAGSIVLGGVIGSFINKKLAEKLVKQEAWAQLDIMHQKFMQGYLRGDKADKQKAIEGIKAVKEIKEQIKS